MGSSQEEVVKRYELSAMAKDMGHIKEAVDKLADKIDQMDKKLDDRVSRKEMENFVDNKLTLYKKDHDLVDERRDKTNKNTRLVAIITLIGTIAVAVATIVSALINQGGR